MKYVCAFIWLIFPFLVTAQESGTGVISFTGTIDLASDQVVVDYSWDNYSFSSAEYFLYVRAWHEEILPSGDTIQIQKAIYNFRKSIDGFHIELKNSGGKLTYYAVETAQDIPIEPSSYTQSFIAIQGQTRFTLDNTPTEADVWLNGLLQFPGIWSIEENDIVLSSATNDGDLIDVYYKEGSSNGDTTESANFTITVSEVYFNDATTANSGTIPNASDVYAEGSVVVLENDFPNSGDHFKGYTLNSNGANPSLSLSVTVTQNIEVFAVYDYTDTTSSSTLLDGLISYWSMDETSGTSMFDAISNSLDGEINNATIGQTGIIDKAYSFNGDESYIEIDNATSINLGGDKLTMSAWAKLNTVTGYLMILSKPVSATSHIDPWFSYSLHVGPNGYPRMVISTDNSTNKSTNDTGDIINIGTWYHIVGVYDGSEIRTYLNGSLVVGSNKVVTGNLLQYDTPLRLGANGGFSEVFNGLIDEVSIWNRALTDQEISELYNSGNGNAYPFDGSSGGSTTTNYTLTVTESYLNDAATNNPGSIDQASQDYADGTSITTEVLTTDFGDPGLHFSGFYLDDQGVTPFSDFNINENIEIFAVYDYTESSSSNLLDGLVSCWKLDETTGTLVEDTHGGNNGIIVNYPALGEVGVVGSAYSFDGSDDYAYVDYDTSLTPEMFTVSIWINPGNYTGDLEGIFVGAGGSGWSHGYRFCRYETLTHFHWGNGSSSSKTLNYGDLEIGVWSHLVATYSGSSVNIYLNGVYISSGTNAFNYDPENPSWHNLHIARAGGLNNFNGKIDQIGFWNKVLTPDEITELYNSGNGKAYPFESNITQVVDTYQAEDASSMSATVETLHAGYTGSGFVDYGTWVEWDNVIGYGANATITFTYANGSSSRPCELSVNGVVVTTIDFNYTSEWTNWETESVDVFLNNGTNTLKLEAIGSGPNLDKIDVSSINITQ